MPNNREWALLLWAAVFGVWVLSRRDLRRSIYNIARVAASPKILIPLALAALWIGLEVWVAARFALWLPSHTTATVIWCITSGLALFGRFDRIEKESAYFRRTALAAFKPVVLLEVLVGAFVFPLPVEALLLPTAAFLGLLAFVAGREAQHGAWRRVADGAVALTGLGLLSYTVANIITNWTVLDKRDLLLQVALPVWLTLGLLPFVYSVALWAAYEVAIIRIDFKASHGWRAQLRSRLALLVGFHVRVGDPATFGDRGPQEVAAAPSFREALEAVRNYRRGQQNAKQQEAEKRAGLVRFAGVEGTDPDGRRLDRREFEETVDALEYFAMCMMGWYRRENRYQGDLPERLQDGFTRHGLPLSSGITMRLSADAQSWYAWRRTVTGWCFAIGAAGPPPDQWKYDGPEPPRGFPGADAMWGHYPHTNEASPNW